MKSDAIVVGAGIVGAACAHFLARRGITVTVVDPEPIGSGATAACMGHIVVMDDSEAQFRLTNRSQALWRELQPRLSERCELEDRGTIWVAADESQLAHASKRAVFYRERGVAAELLDAPQLQREEPELRSGLPGGLLVPGDKVVYPSAVAEYLVAQAGVCTVRRRATSVEAADVRLDSGETLSAAIIINAAGDRAAELTPGLPVEPKKGHLAITDRYPGRVTRQLIELGYLESAHGGAAESIAFNVQPRATGQLLIGSSRQFVGYDRRLDRPILRRMLRLACGYVPGLQDMQIVRAWTGLRPSTPDNLPLIGLSATGVWVAAGHEGLGIATSLATGELIADLITGESPHLDPSPYAATRVMHAH